MIDPVAAPDAEPADEDGPARDAGLDRLVYFSDGVFAIAITLLALDIRLPALPAGAGDAELLHGLAELGPQYFSFAISFFAIGCYWLAHHRMFGLIVRNDPVLLLLNLLLLMGIAFIPFPTAVIGDFDNRTANVFYALVLAVVGLISGGMWLYASIGARLTGPLDRRRLRTSLLRTFVVPVGFAISAAVALVAPAVARDLWYVVGAVEIVIIFLDARGRTWPSGG